MHTNMSAYKLRKGGKNDKFKKLSYQVSIPKLYFMKNMTGCKCKPLNRYARRKLSNPEVQRWTTNTFPVSIAIT